MPIDSNRSKKLAEIYQFKYTQGKRLMQNNNNFFSFF